MNESTLEEDAREMESAEPAAASTALAVPLAASAASLAFQLLQVPATGRSGLPTALAFFFPLALAFSLVALVASRAGVATWLTRHGMAWVTRLVAVAAAGIVFVTGATLSNVLLVDMPTEKLTLAGCGVSAIVALLSIPMAMRFARRGSISARLERRWRESLLLLACATGAGASLADAYCFPRAFRPAHLCLVAIGLAAFAIAGTACYQVRFLDATRRVWLRRFGGLSVLLVAWGFASVTRPASIDRLVRVPSGARSVLLTARALSHRNGDASSFGGLIAPVGAAAPIELPPAVDYPKAAAPSAPSAVVLITIDAFRCGFGTRERDELTNACPELTKLAGEGRLRTDVHARASHTLGSIYTILAFRGDGSLTSLPLAMRQRGYRTEAISTHDRLLDAPGMRAAFDYTDETLAPSTRRGATTTSDQVTALALARIRPALAARRPTFFWIHYFDTHAPYVSAPGSRFALPHMGNYLAEVRRTDAAIGALRAGLEAAGAGDDLAIFVTADHGEEFLEHGGEEHGITLYEEVVRVPFLAWRSGADGKRGLPLELPAGDVDMSPYLVSVVTGAPFQPSTALMMTISPPNDAQVGLVYGGMKYVLHHQLGYEELFDLNADPHERNDLHASSPNTGRMRQILGFLLRREEEAPTTL